MRRVVVLMLDGLRRDFVTPEHMPHLTALRDRAAWFAAHRSVLPSVTRCVSACFATGCFPARHGVQGNTMALLEEDRLVVHDSGQPWFLQHRRRVTGRSMDVPTLAERLEERGGSCIMGNVSPGATYTQDPDGFGTLHHRAGSFGPGRISIEDGFAEITPDLAGDAAMVEHFTTKVLFGQRPALAQLWTCEPDHIQHEAPLGSPEHLAALRGADAHAGLVIEAAGRLRGAGDDVLLLIGSDHGHQTVSGVVDAGTALANAVPALAAAGEDVQVVPNGTAVLVYVHPRQAGLLPAIGDALASMSWAGRIIGPADLASVGQSGANGLAWIVSTAEQPGANGYGAPGISLASKPLVGKPDRLGHGQHGGQGISEQSPVLTLQGRGFEPGAVRKDTTCIVDVAPTLLKHLGVTADDMDGRSLQAPVNALTSATEEACCMGRCGCRNDPSPG